MDISTASVVGQTVNDPEIMIAFAGILTGLVKLALLAIAGLTGRLINQRLNVENSTWKQKLAFRLVCYAEKKIAGNVDRQAYVGKELSRLLGGRVTQEEIQNLLEEAVVKLETTMKGATVK